LFFLGREESALSSVHQRANSLLIKGGHVVDPSQSLDGVADVLIENGHIAGIGKITREADQTFDASGLIVAPGFIDLHVHLREPGQWQKETIATGSAAAAAGGFTSVCAMPNTSPINDIPAITRWMTASERGAVVNVFPIAAATIGSQGERLSDYFALANAGAVAVTDDGKPLLSDRIMREAMQQAVLAGLAVVQHAEDTTLTQGASMNEGPTALRLGLRGMPIAAEARIVERDIDLAAETGAHLHVAHVSTAAALDAIREGKARGVNVTCEVTPHHFTLTDEDIGDYDTHHKMNPPLRSRADRDAMIQGLLDGTIDAIATDHAPHAVHEKTVEFENAPFGITGLETAFALAIGQLVNQRGMTLSRLMTLLSTNPARLFKLEGRGSLKAGSHADLAIVDAKQRWVYEAAKGKSKAVNTPFDGREFAGKVIATIISGLVVAGASGGTASGA
jgi:dihydroorotase